jgi:hypothetical protein
MRKGDKLEFPFSDFTGGEASIFPVNKMPPKYSLKLQNCHVSETGGIAKDPGYTKVNTTQVDETLTSGFEFRKSDGTSEKLTAGGGKIYKSSGTTLSSLTTGLDASAKVFFSQMNDLAIITNGVDAPKKYNGTAVAALGGTPPATAFKSLVHKGRVWFIERTNKMLATHSALNNPEDYTTSGDAGYIDFKYVLKKGDELLDMFTYVDLHVFVFRNHVAIYSGSNPTATGDYRLVQLIEGAGAVSSDLIQPIGTDLAIYYDSGVKSLKQIVSTGNLNMNDLSELIDPTLRGELATFPDGPFASAHYPAKGWLLFLIGNKVWVYSYTWKAWARIVGADIKGMFNTADKKLYLCGTGYLYEYGSGYDFAGANPYMQWDTAWLSFLKAGNKCYPKVAQITMKPGAVTTLNLGLSYDLAWGMGENFIPFATQTPPAMMDTAVPDTWEASPVVMDDATIWEPVRVPVFGGGRSVQLTFTNSSTKGPIEILDILLQSEVGNI